MVCVTCCKIYRPKKNGVYIIEGMPNGNGPDATWSPYKLWVGDLLECPECKHQVVGGIPLSPIAEHFQPDFQKWVDQLNPMLTVTDCGPLHLGSPVLTAANGKKQRRELTVLEISNKFDDIETFISEIRDKFTQLRENEERNA